MTGTAVGTVGGRRKPGARYHPASANESGVKPGAAEGVEPRREVPFVFLQVHDTRVHVGPWGNIRPPRRKGDTKRRGGGSLDCLGDL